MSYLYIGIKGQCVCIDKDSGEVQWQTQLKSTSSVTNLYIEGNRIFAYSGGHLFCLNRSDGEVLWENELKGLGYGPCIIAGENSATHFHANQAAQQANTAAVMAAAVATTGSQSS